MAGVESLICNTDLRDDDELKRERSETEWFTYEIKSCRRGVKVEFICLSGSWILTGWCQPVGYRDRGKRRQNRRIQD